MLNFKKLKVDEWAIWVKVRTFSHQFIDIHIKSSKVRNSQRCNWCEVKSEGTHEIKTWIQQFEIFPNDFEIINTWLVLLVHVNHLYGQKTNGRDLLVV